MRSRVASETLPCPLITRDTVAVDTCASRATSLRVTPIPSPGPLASVYIWHVSACLKNVSEPTPPTGLVQEVVLAPCDVPRDRKSTRLNSSHSQISYAVF